MALSPPQGLSVPNNTRHREPAFPLTPPYGTKQTHCHCNVQHERKAHKLGLEMWAMVTGLRVVQVAQSSGVGGPLRRMKCSDAYSRTIRRVFLLNNLKEL